MKWYATILAVLCSTMGARAQDPFPQFEARTYKEGDKVLKYRLLVPKGYRPGTAWPLIVWLHGSGEKGGDTEPTRRPANFDQTAPEACLFVMKRRKP